MESVTARPKTRVALPPFARVLRGLGRGMHPYLELLPGAANSPALARVQADAGKREALLHGARVDLREERGYCWVDDDVPCVVLARGYYRDGADLDLYLDLLHELTHLRQHGDGLNIWDESRVYVDRPTEIEGYAVAIEEGRRLGMSEQEVTDHLSNPWISPGDVERLRGNVDLWLRTHPV